MKPLYIILLLLSSWIPCHQALGEEDNSLPRPMASPSTVDSPLHWPLSPSKFEEETTVENNALLSADEAFILSVQSPSPGLLVAHWDIANGYYLYRDKLAFVVKEGDSILGTPQLPVGVVKTDIKYGSIEVYEYGVDIPIPVQESSERTQLTLTTTYQGCADNRLCYPPIEKTQVIVLAPGIHSTSAKVLSPPPAPVEEQSKWLPDNGSSTAEINYNATNHGTIDEDKFLKAEEAFILSVASPDKNRIVLQWQIAEGYYLYRDKMKFTTAAGNQLGTPQLPTATFRNDPLFGKVAIYSQSPLEITVPVTAEGVAQVTLTVAYQGCAFAGLCYPPTQTTVEVSLGKGPVITSEVDQIAGLLAHASLWYTLVLFFGFGLLLSLTPCVYPMIPILSSLIVGQGQRVNLSMAVTMSVIYVLAMSVTYAVVGALTGLLGENLQAAFQSPWILISFSLVFVALALSMFGCYELQLPSALQTKLSQWSNQQQGGNWLGVAIMGILSALIVGPCVAAPLAGALIYISQTGNAVLGGLALFMMGLGMGVPLILIGASAGHLLPKKGEWMAAVKAVFGVLLLAVAIWMLARILPAPVTMLLWASLSIISAVYMGALDQLSAEVSGWRKLWKGLGIILLIYGTLLMIGAARGHFNPLRPLQSMTSIGNDSSATIANAPLVSFKPIKGLADLQRELAVAKTKQQPVLLDFYADWCISCKEMEDFTFTDPAVQKLLSRFILLRADVTANDELDKALYQHFGIYGPPVILFFTADGQEQRPYRVVGLMTAAEFHSHLMKVL